MIPIAVLMCHAPIVIPAIGAARAADCATSTRAMAEAAQALIDAAPDVLVVLSPHTPRHKDAYGVVLGEQLGGSFARFGHPSVGLTLPAAPDYIERLRTACARAAVPLGPVRPEPLDHGALVPLWFAFEAGWRGPTVVLAVPWEPRDPQPFGEALAAAAGDQRVAILASGDMSHRLKPGAPAGFDPKAQTFDDTFRELVAAGRYRDAANVEASLRKLAAEDVVDTTAIAAAAVGWRSDNHRSIAYEGPFGVGYLEAVLFQEAAGAHT